MSLMDRLRHQYPFIDPVRLQPQSVAAGIPGQVEQELAIHSRLMEMMALDFGAWLIPAAGICFVLWRKALDVLQPALAGARHQISEFAWKSELKRRFSP